MRDCFATSHCCDLDHLDLDVRCNLRQCTLGFPEFDIDPGLGHQPGLGNSRSHSLDLVSAFS